MENEDMDFSESENEEGVEEATEEQPEETPNKDWKSLYENQKIRAEKAEDRLKKLQPKKEESKNEPSKPNGLDYGAKAYLKAYGISGSDELALVKQFQDRGFELDNIVEDDVFTAKLNNLREAKASTNAVPKGTKRSGQPVSNELDEAMAKYNETGELPQDFETRNKLIDKITDKENKAMFSGPSVFGTPAHRE